MFEPTASLFEKESIGHIVASFGIESGKIPYTTFMAKESYLNENKDVIQRFTKALYKAQQWVDSHSPKEIAKVIEPYFKDTPLIIIETVTQRYKEQHSYATNPILDVEEWNNLQTIMDEAGELTLVGSLAQFEREQIAERVRMVVVQKIKQGEWKGGQAPYGYDYIDGELRINDTESVVVRKING